MITKLTGVVLSSNNSGDSDKFFTLFSRETGLVSVIAKGVRKLNSKRSPSLDTCNLVVINCTQGKGEYYFVNEAKLVDNFSRIKSNLAVSSWVYYILEVVKNVSAAGQEDIMLFDALVTTLKELDSFPNKRTVYNFLRKVITTAGVWDNSFYQEYPYLNYINSSDTASKSDQLKIDLFFAEKISDLIEKDINSKKLLSSL